MREKIKELNKRKIYTKEQISKLAKFRNKFLNTYFFHTELWNDKEHKFDSVVEVRGISKTEKENFERIDAILERLK